MCIYLLFPIWGYCQDSSPGYIVDLNGERSEGLILNGNSLNRYFGCNFRSTTEETFTYYTPDQIKGYGLINGPNFTSVSITLDRTPQKMFVEVKLEGLINIYTFFDRSFIAKSNQQTELIFTPSQAGFNQNLIVQIMQDCDRLSRRLEMQFVNNLDYVMELTRIYNSCSEPEPERTIQLNWHPFMGVDLLKLKLSSDENQYTKIDGTRMNNSKLMSGGFYISLKHKNWKSLSIYTGVYYSSHSFSKLITTNQQIDELHIESKNISIPVYAVFTANSTNKRWLPYVRLGIQKPFAVDAKSKWLTETESGNLIFIENRTLFKSFKEPLLFSLCPGTHVDLGSNLKGFAELSYNFGSSALEPWGSVSLSGIQLRIGINY